MRLSGWDVVRLDRGGLWANVGGELWWGEFFAGIGVDFGWDGVGGVAAVAVVFADFVVLDCEGTEEDGAHFEVGFGGFWEGAENAEDARGHVTLEVFAVLFELGAGWELFEACVEGHLAEEGVGVVFEEFEVGHEFEVSDVVEMVGFDVEDDVFEECFFFDAFDVGDGGDGQSEWALEYALGCLTLRGIFAEECWHFGDAGVEA